MKRRILLLVGQIVALSLPFVPLPAQATSPGLQLNPLKYEDTLLNDHIHTGYVDVANPADTTVRIQTDVQGFRQADLDGNLEFFPDDPLKQGIKLSLTDFELGPRESIRVAFTVDPTKLPKGGVYATLFFRTVPPDQSSGTSFVAESANVGTLLLLQNGGPGEHIGRIAQFDVPFWQFGSGLTGQARYQNTNRTTTPIAFAPQLATRVLPWGRRTGFTGPYVLPGATRQFRIQHPGSYLGLLPLTLIDTTSGQHQTRWVVACTGAYTYGVLITIMLLILWAIYRTIRRQPLLPHRFAHPPVPPSHHPRHRLLSWLRRLIRHLRRRRAVTKRPLDGLSRKP